MNNRDPIKFTLLENGNDLQCLERGDLVKIIFQNEPTWKYEEKEEVGSYHGVYRNGHLQFVMPAEMRGEYIRMYRARKSEVKLRDGAIVINEDGSSTHTFDEKDENYNSLNKTLKLAGLR